MKSYLKIKIFNGKGGFSNILVIKDMESQVQKEYLSDGYSLSQEVKNIVLNEGIKEFVIPSITLHENQIEKVLYDLFIDYKQLKNKKNKGE